MSTVSLQKHGDPDEDWEKLTCEAEKHVYARRGGKEADESWIPKRT